MADTTTLPGVDRRPLISYLRIQADFEQQMLAILQSASVSIDAELARLVNRSGIGAGIRLEQLAQTQAAIHRQTSTLFNRLGLSLEASRADAAAAAVETMHPAKLLGEIFSAADRDYMLRSAQATAKRGIELAEARMNLSQLPLSARVYETEKLVDGTIDRIINDALTRGASAAELAQDVMGFIRPDTPGGVKYAAQRLGRTELNNAFHATQVQQAVDTPWITALRWNLSGSHPKPDECNDYAERAHMPGGEAGVWKPEEVPGKPHPNCLCFTTPITPGRDEFVKEFQTGAYDDFLQSEFPDLETAVPSVERPVFLPKSMRTTKVGEPMSIVDSLRGANPKMEFGGLDYRVNCQKAAAAYELRRRGVLAEAQAGQGGVVGEINYADMWVNPKTGISAMETGVKSADEFAAFAADDPIGARYILNMKWESGGAHMFNAEKTADGIRYLDAQLNQGDVAGYWDRARKGFNVYVFRADTLDPSEWMSTFVMKGKP